MKTNKKKVKAFSSVCAWLYHTSSHTSACHLQSKYYLTKWKACSLTESWKWGCLYIHHKNTIFCDATLCNVAFYRRFGGIHCKQPEDGGTLLWIVGKLLTDYTVSHWIVTAVRTSNICRHCSFIDSESFLFDIGMMEYESGLQACCFHVNFLSTAVTSEV